MLLDLEALKNIGVIIAYFQPQANIYMARTFHTEYDQCVNIIQFGQPYFQ